MAVYFFKDRVEGSVKIGFSADPLMRLQYLRESFPRLTTFRLFLDGGRHMERWFHKRFDSVRLHGEWFRYSPLMNHVEAPAEVRRIRPRLGRLPGWMDAAVIGQIVRAASKAVDGAEQAK